MSKDEIRVDIYSLTQVLANQVSRDSMVQVNPNASTSALKISYFTSMNPSTFFGSKMEDDPKGFTDEVFKVLDSMGGVF